MCRAKHLGQGANQAFEDIDLLIQLLDKYNPDAAAPTTSTLDKVFSELAEARGPRISNMLKLAKAQGEARTAKGVEACIARNKAVRELWADEEAMVSAREGFYRPTSESQSDKY